MTCEKAEPRIALFVSGDLGRVEARDLERHLGICEDCSALLRAYRETIIAVGALGVERPTTEDYRTIRQAVLKRIDAESTRAWRTRSLWTWPRWQRYALAATLIGLMLLGLEWAWTQISTIRTIKPSPPQMAEAVPPKDAGAATAETSGPQPVPEKHPFRTIPEAGRQIGPIQLARLPVDAVIPGVVFDVPVITPMKIEPDRWQVPTQMASTIVKMETSDPDIVIVWLLGAQGEEKWKE